MNFAQWLFLEENFQSNRFQSIGERIKSGKKQEAKIFRSMTKEHGWEIRQVSENQDKFDKIDGILVHSPEIIPVTLPAPIQIKYRDTGDDILMEVVWEFKNQYDLPTDQLLTGRDMKGGAKLYLCLNKLGTIVRVRLAEEAKKIAKNLLDGILKSRKRVFNIEKSQIRITEDPESKRIKINAYIDPNDPGFSWKKDYPVVDLWQPEVQEPIKQDPSQILPRDVPPSIIPFVLQALESGSATFATPNNSRKTRAIEKYASKRGLSVILDKDRIVFRKVA